MTIIKGRLISPDEAYLRKKRRESAMIEQTLMGMVNKYFANPSEDNYIHWEIEWRNFSRIWNENQSRLLQVRSTDFEDFIIDYLKKKHDEKKREKLQRILRFIFRPLIDRIRLVRGRI